MTIDELKTQEVLKRIARDAKIKQAVLDSPALYRLLLGAAKRYVTGETRADLIRKAGELDEKGYLLSVEYIGENTVDARECQQAKNQFLQLIHECAGTFQPVGISFDLSHLGLLIEPDFAFEQVEEIAREAQKQGQYLMISMEESSKTDVILQLHRRLAERHANVGITLQAQLHRTFGDLRHVLALPGKVRLVKGAYQEEAEAALGRSAELNERYVQLAELCVGSGREVSFATHDPCLIEALEQKGLLQAPHVELEMLYGVRPDLAKQMRQKGCKVRLYLTYGREWYLYLCHRLAEYPPNVHLAIADIAEPERTACLAY